MTGCECDMESCLWLPVCVCASKLNPQHMTTSINCRAIAHSRPLNGKFYVMFIEIDWPQWAHRAHTAMNWEIIICHFSKSHLCSDGRRRWPLWTHRWPERNKITCNYCFVRFAWSNRLSISCASSGVTMTNNGFGNKNRHSKNYYVIFCRMRMRKTREGLGIKRSIQR